MKALVKRRREVGLWMEDVPIPVIGPNDLRIRIRKTAICGTDVHIYNWDPWSQRTISVPMTIGHEFVGEVAEVGCAVSGWEVGDRVSGEGHITCGHCRNCRAGKRHLCRNTCGVGVDRDGAFAEYLSLPAGNAFRVPEGISDSIATILDPLGNAAHTTLSFDVVGEDVLITGAGPIGCLAVAIARHVGARHVVITDVNDYRLGLAAKMGRVRASNPLRESLRDVMAELGMVEGFDVALEMSGNRQAFASLLEVMNHGGRVACLGIFPEPVELDWIQVILKGLTLKGIYGREMYETWYKMASMLQSGLNIEPVITHRFPISRWEEAFAIMRSGKSGKVILEWEA
ncbi:MAG: L-threonine 3-dehydrogenase [Armatimonadetes bacterium]|nr:L-threonine 3-dehydrogenase [Armatimonadota bacterium]